MRFIDRINLRALLSLALALALLIIGFSLAAYAQTANVTLRWTAPTTHTDETPITAPLTYNIYAGAKGATKAKVGSTSAGITQFIAVNTAIGACFSVTAVETGAGESAQSNELCMAAVPKPPGAISFVAIIVQ